MAEVSLRNVVKTFGSNEVIHGINLEINSGEFVVFVGPSGCGKSTLLRMVAGLEDITSGEIMIGGRVVNDLPPRARDVAMVFQDYALYPHKSVFENMAFGLGLRKLPGQEIQARVREAAGILQIEHLFERKPRELSGGQRQRVAMGRAIVRHPNAFPSTSRCPTSTRCCARRCESRSRNCTRSSATPSSTLRPIKSR